MLSLSLSLSLSHTHTHTHAHTRTHAHTHTDATVMLVFMFYYLIHVQSTNKCSQSYPVQKQNTQIFVIIVLQHTRQNWAFSEFYKQTIRTQELESVSSIDRPYAYGNYSGNFREFLRQTTRIQEPVWALSELHRTGTPIWASVSSTEQNRNSNLSVSKLHRTETTVCASVSSEGGPLAYRNRS